MAKIGVTGAQGRLGRELVEQGCIPITIDVMRTNDMRLAIEAAGVDTVVHCAAYTDVDKCEDRPMYAATVNMGGVSSLCKAFDGKIVYVSTDYVFDGLLGPYSESAIPSPINIYGWSKLGGELVLQGQRDSEFLIVRTTILFGPGGDDFVGKVGKQLRMGKTIRLPDGLYGSPTYIPHLAEDILLAIDKDVDGILNLAGGRVVSRYKLGKKIAQAAGVSEGLVRRGDMTGRANRPMRAGLQINKALGLGFPCRDPYDAIKKILDRRRKAERHK